MRANDAQANPGRASKKRRRDNLAHSLSELPRQAGTGGKASKSSLERDLTHLL